MQVEALKAIYGNVPDEVILDVPIGLADLETVTDIMDVKNRFLI